MLTTEHFAPDNPMLDNVSHTSNISLARGLCKHTSLWMSCLP